MAGASEDSYRLRYGVNYYDRLRYGVNYYDRLMYGVNYYDRLRYGVNYYDRLRYGVNYYDRLRYGVNYYDRLMKLNNVHTCTCAYYINVHNILMYMYVHAGFAAVGAEDRQESD